MKVTVKQVAPSVATARLLAPDLVKVATKPPTAGQPGQAPTPEQIQAAVDAYLIAHPPKDGEDATDDQIAAASS